MSSGVAQQPTVRATVRKRKDKKFIAYYFSQQPSVVNDLLTELREHIPDAFTTFEHQPITLPTGKKITHRHILWVPPDDLDKYKAWQKEQQRLNHLALEKARELQLDSLTLDEVLEATPLDAPVRQERPTPRPLVPPKPPIQKPQRQPPPWMNMPAVIRDGNGNEYHWDTLATSKPKVVPEDTCQAVPESLPPCNEDMAAPPKQRESARNVPTGHKGITRQEYEKYSRSGYRASVTWKGVSKSKFFSDRCYGDRLASLDAAITWRNATEKKLGKPRTDVIIMGKTWSNTGYQGISQLVKDGRYNVFEVSWIDAEHKKHTAQVSIDKWGRKEALRRAKHIRLAKWKERIRSNEGKRF